MEANTKTCKKCLFKVPHIPNGMFPSTKEFRYVDAFGRQWSGRTCPNCHAEKAKLRAQKKTAERKCQS